MPKGMSAEFCREIGKNTRFNSETGRLAGQKSGMMKKKRKTLAKMIEDCSTNEDIKQIAMGMIARAKNSTMAATALRDTLGEKPAEKMDVTAEVVTVTAEERAEARRAYAESLMESWMP